MSINKKKFNKRSKSFTLVVENKINILIDPSKYDEAMTLKEIVDFEVYGDGFRDNLYCVEDKMQIDGVTANIGKEKYIVQINGNVITNSDLLKPIKGQNLVVNNQIIALDESEMKILKFLFQHGYDFINKELNKNKNRTHSIAQEYSDMLDDAHDKTQMLENKIFDNDLIMVTGD